MRNYARSIISCTLLLSSAYLTAETVVIPIASQAPQLSAIERPVAGQSQASVRQRFGEPTATSGPNGEPPITRWDYAEFTVYFDRTTVIHSVLRHQPQAVENAPVASDNQ